MIAMTAMTAPVMASVTFDPMRGNIATLDHVLVVEDDPMLRMLITKTLESCFKIGAIHEASDGQWGLRLWQEKPLDLIITDMQMPLMGGVEMVLEIRRKDPIIPIMMMSGALADPFAQDDFTAFINKPFKAHEIAATIDGLFHE